MYEHALHCSHRYEYMSCVLKKYTRLELLLYVYIDHEVKIQLFIVILMLVVKLLVMVLL